METRTAADPQLNEARVRVTALLRQAIQDCRNLMNEVYPHALADFGIVAAIGEELREFREQAECQTSFEVHNQLDLAQDAEITLYRVFHEAISNIRRHGAGVRNVSVRLDRRDDGVVLTIEDDGDAFNVAAAMRDKRLGGLATMRRRVEITGGTFEATSSAGCGTRVIARVGRARNLADKVPRR